MVIKNVLKLADCPFMKALFIKLFICFTGTNNLSELNGEGFLCCAREDGAKGNCFPPDQRCAYWITMLGETFFFFSPLYEALKLLGRKKFKGETWNNFFLVLSSVHEVCQFSWTSRMPTTSIINHLVNHARTSFTCQRINKYCYNYRKLSYDGFMVWGNFLVDLNHSLWLLSWNRADVTLITNYSVQSAVFIRLYLFEEQVWKAWTSFIELKPKAKLSPIK